MKNINFGIDLGTTNSGIGKFENGKVIIYKNPVGFSDTIPSVVSFRKGRIQVGEKARELLRSDSGNVISSFKRKMGTSHIYSIPDNGETYTPIALSAILLKEMAGFIPDSLPEAVVITIPASFDTIQSNATKKAGYEAGFAEVVLLQEPIAACLAYANTQNIDIEQPKKWLVYDFGGGTFDAAIVNINQRELRVIDHKGNNYLGGVDLDNLIVQKLICPQLEEKLGWTDAWKKLSSRTDIRYTKLYFELLYKAEEAKKELSLKNTSIIELEIDEDDVFLEIMLKREDFTAVISPLFEESLALTHQLLEDNSITPQDIERIILVGGTTYIPYIREELNKQLGITIDSTIDPTTAVIVGAGYYAGSKTVQIEKSSEAELPATTTIDLKLVYETNSKDEEELIMGLAENFSGFYRITRRDGGFDTGMLAFDGKFTEFVKVMPQMANLFSVKVYDKKQLLVKQEDITINQGIYNVLGQPLPNDICIELDDTDGTTFLEKIFRKNDILPLRKTIYKTISRTILPDSGDKLIINILEGKAGTLPGSNLSIGYIEINAEKLPSALLKGMDIELKFTITESRDLNISVYISSLDFELTETFNPHERVLAAEKLKQEMIEVIQKVNMEIALAPFDEDNYVYYGKLKNISNELEKLVAETHDLIGDTTTEVKYRIDERKRQCLQRYDALTRHKLVLTEIEEYRKRKLNLEFFLPKASPAQQEEYNKLMLTEKEILESNEKTMIKRRADELNKLTNAIYNEQDEAYIYLFIKYRNMHISQFEDAKQAEKLLTEGNTAMDKGSYKELKYITLNLYNLLRVRPTGNDPEDISGSNLGIK